MPKSEKHSLPQCSSLFTFSLSLTPLFFPIQTIWVFSVFTLKPDILPKISSILRAAWRESSVPFSIIVVSSGNCVIFIYFCLIMMPFIFLLFIIIRYKIWAHKIKR